MYEAHGFTIVNAKNKEEAITYTKEEYELEDENIVVREVIEINKEPGVKLLVWEDEN